MNIGAKRAKGRAIIFMDSDVSSESMDWLNRISEKVLGNPLKIVHGYGFCQDSKYPEQCFTSNGLVTCSDFQSDIQTNPGLVIGMSKEILKKNDYLNPYNIMGGGDSIVLHEYLSPKYPSCRAWAECRPRIANIIRKLPVCGEFDYVNCFVIHENHGDFSTKNYVTRHYATDYFTKEIRDIVKIGDNGLLEWRNKNCFERKLVKGKPLMKTEEDIKEICKEILKENKKWKLNFASIAARK